MQRPIVAVEGRVLDAAGQVFARKNDVVAATQVKVTRKEEGPGFRIELSQDEMGSYRAIIENAEGVQLIKVAAEELPARFLRLELGAASLVGHAGLAHLDSPWGGARVGGAFGRGRFFALDIGVEGGGGPEGFTTFTTGAEIRACPRARLSPFGRAEMGVLSRSLNPLFVVVGVGGGIAIRLAPGLGLRAGVTRSSHCAWEEGHAGPVQLYGAFEYRW